MRFRVVIETTTKAREFPFDTPAEPRSAANDLWRWAKGNHEHGKVRLYEHEGGRQRGGGRLMASALASVGSVADRRTRLGR